jgi:glycine cleavage system H protein
MRDPMIEKDFNDGNKLVLRGIFQHASSGAWPGPCHYKFPKGRLISMVAILVLLTVIAFLTIDFFVQRAEARRALLTAAAGAKEKVEAALAGSRTPVVGPLTRLPKGIFFDPSHQWMELEKMTGDLRLGVDAFLMNLLGKPSGIEMASVGTDVRRGDAVATLRRGGRSIVLRAPVDGRIEAVNADAAAHPARLAENPFGQNWLYRIAPNRLDVSALASRKLGEQAVDWMRGEYARLRDFFAAIPNPAFAGVTLQDGGAFVDGCAEALDDAQWDRLSKEFFGKTA